MSDDEFGDFAGSSWVETDSRTPKTMEDESSFAELQKNDAGASDNTNSISVEVEKAAEFAKNDDFADFGDFSSGIGENENANEEVGKIAFGDFSATSTTSTSMETENTEVVSSKKDADDKDDFGEFGNFSTTTSDNGFGDFSSKIASDEEKNREESPQGLSGNDDDFGTFGDFASSSESATVDFGDFSDRQTASFGQFASPPPPLLQSKSRELSFDEQIKASFDIHNLELGRMDKTRLKITSIWSALKAASNTLGNRFDLETSQSGQHLLNVLHVDIHSVLSPGFGGLALPSFGESYLSPTWEGGCVQFPSDSTLLDFTSSESVASPNPVFQEQVPKESNNALFDLDFFTGSPAIPGTPTGQSQSSTLANSDLLALGLFSEDSMMEVTRQEEAISAAPKGSDSFAKIFENLPQHKAKGDLSEKAQAVLRTLPDLSFMHARVLMFPTRFATSPDTPTAGSLL